MGKERPVTLSTTSFSFTSQMSAEALPCAGVGGKEEGREGGREKQDDDGRH
jgi:hypothetical protein